MGGSSTGMHRRIVTDQLPNMLSDEPVKTAEEFGRGARDADTELTFATSRSGMPSPVARPELVVGPCVDGMVLMGFGDGGLLNLNAPEPHLSGWLGQRATDVLGAASYNDHFEDYHRVVERGRAEEMTALCSVPSMTVAKGEEVRKRYGEPSDVFPNLELGMLGGEIVRPSVRRRVKELWGISRTREYYGSSEASMVACAVDESRHLVPLLHRFVLEVEIDGEIVDVREPAEPTEGSILITDPAREAIDLTRYRQGDRVRVHPGDEIPRIEPLGRADNAINVEGALVHPADLYEIVGETFGEDADCLPYVLDATEPIVLEVFVVGASTDRTSAFFDRLFATYSDVEFALAGTVDEQIKVTYVDSIEDVPLPNAEELASRQIVFQSEIE